MKYRFLIFIIVGILILFALSHAVNINDLTREISRFPKERLIYLCILSIIISLLKSWRFFLLLRKNDINVGFWQVCKVYIAGQATSSIPGGEVFRTVILKKETGADTKETSGPVVMQALIVFLSSAIIAIVGSLIYGILLNIALIALVIVLLSIYLIWNQKILFKVFGKIGKVKKLKKPAQTLKAAHKGVRSNMLHKGSDHKPGGIFILSIAIGIVSNIIGGLMIYIIVSAYSLPINFVQSIYIYAMSIIIGAVSGIVPGGIGLAEGGIAGVFVLMKVAFEEAFASVLIFRFINLVFYIFFGAVFLLLFYSKTLIFTKKPIRKK